MSSNAETGSASYLPNGKAYELETWFTDRARRPVSPTNAATSKAKGQGRKVTRSLWQVLADKSRTKRPPNTKIGRNIAHQFQGQRSRSPGRLMLRQKVLHTYELETWYIVGASEHEEVYHGQQHDLQSQRSW